MKLFESIDEDNNSKYNEGEAQIVYKYALILKYFNININDIGIITPYNAQVSILKSLFLKNDINIEINTVDGFQGREKQVILLSCVRSNKKAEIGFLSDIRRLNVSLTRAKRHCMIIGDSSTLNRTIFYKGLIEYIEKNGLIITPYDIEAYKIEDFGDGVLTDNVINTDYRNFTNTIKEKVVKPIETTEIKEKPIKKEKERHDFIDIEMEIKKFYTREREYIEDIFYKLINPWLKEDTNLVYVFPKSLKSYHRQILHSIAEKLHLFHTSCGEEKNRYIILSKISLDGIVEKNTDTKVDESEEVKIIDKTEIDVDNKKVKKEESLFQLHQTKESKHNQIKDCNPFKSIQKAKADDFTFNSLRKKKTEKEQEIPEDMLLDMERGITKCFMKTCNAKNIKNMGIICKYCNMKFCSLHILAEDHGCGDLAR